MPEVWTLRELFDGQKVKIYFALEDATTITGKIVLWLEDAILLEVREGKPPIYLVKKYVYCIERAD